MTAVVVDLAVYRDGPDTPARRALLGRLIAGQVSSREAAREARRVLEER